MITEDWCGDALYNVPVLAKLVEGNPNVEMRIFLRDKNTDLMDQYLNQGMYRSIPVFAFFDENMNEVARFIERPPVQTEELEKKMLEMRRALRAERYLDWRSGVVKEIRGLLKAEAAAPARPDDPLPIRRDPMKAIRVTRPGGPEVMKLEDVAEPHRGSRPGGGEDRGGRPQLHRRVFPHRRLQGAAAAHPRARGRGHGDRGGLRRHRPASAGDRVAYTGIRRLLRADERGCPADRLVKLPDGLTFRDGAAAMLQGMTAHYLVTLDLSPQEGRHRLVHAAAGGMGLLLCQMAKMLGATVIGTVSTEEKAALAKEAGADHVILYTKQDFEAEVKRITGGRGRGRDLRRRGRDDVRQGPRLPAPARAHGAVRRGERAGGCRSTCSVLNAGARSS